MSSDISEKDKKDWEAFVSSDEKIPNKDLSSVKQNNFKVKSIDLHGYTVDEAAHAITALFQIIRERRLTHIRITHGVGRHSQDGRPLLKAYVNRWLKNNPDIVAFASARRSDGGAGVLNAVTSGLFDDRWERT